MWLKKELNFDVCEHINKLRVKEFEKKKQEDAEDLKETIQEFTEFVNNNDMEEDLDMWVDIDWDKSNWALSGLTQSINNIMTQDNNFVRFTSKIISHNYHTDEDVYAVDKRCKAYKRGKIDARNSDHTMDEDLVRHLWNRRDYDAMTKIVKKWMKTKN